MEIPRRAAHCHWVSDNLYSLIFFQEVPPFCFIFLDGGMGILSIF